MSQAQTTNIVIAALGGEGGGVLSDWLTEVALNEGYIAQSTSVPGVAQRTGATIYYLELFPASEAVLRQPVMSLFPTQGDIDIVIASEIVEAGRMVQRGFVTPSRTTLITSDHRVYSVSEKITPGNGITDANEVRRIAKAQSRHFIHDDMKALATQYNTVISATLFGALAGSGALPFKREAFETVIRDTGKAVAANLEAFAASYDRVTGNYVTDNKGEAHKGSVQTFTPASTVDPFTLPEPTTANGRQLLGRINSEFRAQAHEFLYLGIKRMLVYQDADYANLYLDKLDTINNAQRDENGELLREAARYLALWMTYEDIIRVAQIKITPQRFERFSREINIEPGQYFHMVEFLRPQLEEYVSILPPAIAEKMLASNVCQKLAGYFSKGKFVSTNKLSGFLQFYLLSKLKPLRKFGWGYQHEHRQIARWLKAINTTLSDNYPLAVEIAKCGRLIKGYGSTRRRSQRCMSQLLSAIEQGTINSAEQLAALRETALLDPSGEKVFVQLAAVTG